jgi:DNA helicase-2/ATP-dependent DNA helicase PcrA
MVVKSETKGSVTMTAFKDQDEEAIRIADAIYKMGDYESTAILYRMNTRSMLFEKALATRRIPYKVVGALPFYKRKVAKDLLSYCKAATNPKDLESLIRIVNTPKRGFGETKQEKLLNEGRPYLEQVALEMPSIQDFLILLDDIKHKKPGQAIEEIIQKTGYRNTLKEENDIAMLDYFLDIVNGFDSMEDLILTSNFLEEDSGHGVKLMSAHASKGLEFNKVFVVGVEGGIWPHKLSDNIMEENRLYYVAITRAKKYLNISCSKSRLNRGKMETISPSNLFIQSYNFLYKK